MNTSSDKRVHSLGIIAAEVSADRLGAGLVRQLRSDLPLDISGVGNIELEQQGLNSWIDPTELVVMGITEPILKLRRLLRWRRQIIQRWLENPPSVFVGVDLPDFNLPIARQLRKNGVKTVQYVSPSVWAWRQGRVKVIAEAVDQVLCLFPFEVDFYRRHNVPATVVGHPLADSIPKEYQPPEEARKRLNLNPDLPCLGLLPGSRAGEIKFIAPTMLQAAQKIMHQHKAMQVVISAAHAALLDRLKALVGDMDCRIVLGNTRDVILAADAVVVASGTATLEVALCRRPMVAAYRMSRLNHAILSRLKRVPWVALPNILLNRTAVPELLQSELTPDKLARELEVILQGEHTVLQSDYQSIHESLALDGDMRATESVKQLLFAR